MNFERQGDYLIYLNSTQIEDVYISYEHSLNEIIKTDKLINDLDEIINISFFGKCSLISNLGGINECINIVGVNISIRIEYEEDEHISSRIIELEKGEIIRSDSMLVDINLYINTIAIGINKDEMYISIIYSIYS